MKKDTPPTVACRATQILVVACRATRISVASLLFSATSLAYVPPSFHIVNTLAKRHAGIGVSTFKHRIVFYKKSGELLAAVNETLKIDESGLMIIKITNDEGAEVQKTRNLTTMPLTDRSVIYDLLYNKNSDLIFDKFKSIGLPVKTQKELYARDIDRDIARGSNREDPPAQAPPPATDLTEGGTEASVLNIAKNLPSPYTAEPRLALSRFENKICIVLGFVPATENQAASSQLWIEKDSLLPIRLVLPEKTEFKFSGFYQYKTVLYPKIVQLYREGTLWAKIDTIDVLIGVVEKETTSKPAPIEGDLKALLEHYFTLAR